MGDFVRHNCGIVVAPTLDDAYHGTDAQQNRGKELTGMVGTGEHGIDAVKWVGTVGRLSPDAIHTLLPDGGFFGGHVRYSTGGGKGADLAFAHPQVLGGTVEERGEHVVIRGARMAILHNGNIPASELAGFEEELADMPSHLRGFDTLALLTLCDRLGPEEVVRRVRGSYAAALFDARHPGEVVVFRDRYGIKPLWLGEKGRQPVAASEDSAIKLIGGKPKRAVRPGEVVRLHRTDFAGAIAAPAEPRGCVYEDLYLARSASTRGGKEVRQIRYELGQMLAQEFRPAVDVVTWVPSCPEPAAEGYSVATGVPCDELLYKIRGDRSFMGATQAEREEAIRKALWVTDRARVAGKRVLLIDDSTVRGTVSKVAVERLREAGAREVHFALYTPPVAPRITEGGALVPTGCEYGVDIPLEPRTGEAYLSRAAPRPEEVARVVGATSVHYLSLGRMFEVLEVTPSRSCYRCLGGPKPFAHD